MTEGGRGMGANKKKEERDRSLGGFVLTFSYVFANVKETQKKQKKENAHTTQRANTKRHKAQSEHDLSNLITVTARMNTAKKKKKISAGEDGQEW